MHEIYKSINQFSLCDHAFQFSSLYIIDFSIFGLYVLIHSFLRKCNKTLRFRSPHMFNFCTIYKQEVMKGNFPTDLKMVTAYCV